MVKKKEIKKKLGKKENKKKVIKSKEDSSSKLILTVIVLCAIVLILILVWKGISTQVKFHEYGGVEYETVSYGDLILQQTAIEVMHEGKLTPYNFYLRTPIKKLKEISFDASDTFEIMKIMGFRLESEFDCDGDQTIAIANLVSLNTQIGAQAVVDPDAPCDERYNLFIFEEGDKTEIIEISPKCYSVKVANCEILPATEKIMVEIFSKYNQLE